jgi:serine protease
MQVQNIRRWIVPFALLGLVAGCERTRSPVSSETDAAFSRGADGVAPLRLQQQAGIPGQYIVVFRRDRVSQAAEVAEQMVRAHGGRVLHTYESALKGFAATLPPQAVEALRRNPNVAYIEQDGMAYTTQTVQPNATWGLDRIDQRDLPLSTTYSYTATGAGVRVYVIDSGIRMSHDEFGGRASLGSDFVSPSLNGGDCNGHGTHVAGTIAGATYGVAKEAMVISVRVFPCSGGTATSTIIGAVDWVTANHVKPAVVNYSGGGSFFQAHNDAVDGLIAAGVQHVTAAGNTNTDACNVSPASTPNAITVGATHINDARTSPTTTGSWGSNWGTCVNIFAPGQGITSAWWQSDTQLETIGGTSMAAPHVAGVAALYLQNNPAHTPAQVRDAIYRSATPGRLSNIGTGSPNLLLFSTAESPTTPHMVLDHPSLTLLFIDGVLVSGQPSVSLSNAGAAPYSWTAATNQPWLTVTPNSGSLAAGATTLLTVQVDASSLPGGTHTGTVTVTSPEAPNSPKTLAVTVQVPSTLALGQQVGGLSGATNSWRYFAVAVSEAGTNLVIRTSGGTGDADLYVRRGSLPTAALFDCRSWTDTNNETCTFAAPAAGTYYVGINGYSAYAGLTVEATMRPAAPSNLAGTPVSPSQINLAWTDNSSLETGFTLQRRQQAGGVWGDWSDVGSPAANATGFTNTGLSAETPYQYQLRACNAAGCSAWTLSSTITTPAPEGPPAAPLQLRGTAASGPRIDLTWNDQSSDETHFEIQRRIRPTGGEVWPAGWDVVAADLAPDTQAYADTGFSPGSQAQYRIRACRGSLCSDWVRSLNVDLRGFFGPAAPTAVQGSVVSRTAITLVWEQPDGEVPVEFFQLERRQTSGSTTDWTLIAGSLAAGQRGHADGTLQPGTRYRYRISACNAYGCSERTVTPQLTTLP